MLNWKKLFIQNVKQNIVVLILDVWVIESSMFVVWMPDWVYSLLWQTG